jgi:hypothetical protein
MYVVCLLFYAIGDFCFSIFICFYICLSPFPECSEAPLGEERVFYPFKICLLSTFSDGNVVNSICADGICTNSDYVLRCTKRLLANDLAISQNSGVLYLS